MDKRPDNQQPPGRPHTEAEVAQGVALLQGQAEGLRANLEKLRQELAGVQSDIARDRGTQLLEANQRLVLAALAAEAIAETASSNLAALTRSSQHDALTLTANRALMLKRMNVAIDDAREYQKHLAVLFLDLDHFRHINNSFGHLGGDEVLKLVARRLKLALPDSATVSRHGGDEFLILVVDVTLPSEVAAIATQILSAIAAPSLVGDVLLQLSASIGIAIYPQDGEDVEALVDHADVAMFRSKRHTPGSFRFHEAEMATDASPRLPMLGSFTVSPADRNSHAVDEIRISDLREANERLVLAALRSQELEAHAQDAHRQQIKFMAMVAHELRNPLTPIRVAASLLIERETQEEPSLAQLKVIIDGQVTHMARLISDLLDGSRISTGKLRLERTIVEIVDILSTAVEMCRPALEARNQRITVALPPGPIPFYGDPVRLTQIFTNLFDNASKYTPKGGEITLTVTVNEHEVVIAVLDSGIGISPEALPHIFDLFFQDAGAFAHSESGLGIGLALVRDLAHAHGGTVTGHSAGRDLGSEFIVSLPFSKADSHQNPVHP